MGYNVGMKPICIIPARGGSKGVPNKNIRKIGGKPLIAYTIESAIQSKIFSHVIVSTEDKKIAAISKKFGAEVPFLRPKKLSNDIVHVDDVLVHTVKKLQEKGYNFEIFVWRDCTVPLIRNSDIKKSINILKKEKCQTVTAVYRQHLNPYHNIVEITSHGFLEISKKMKSRVRSRQEAPPVFQENGLHTYDVKKFLKSGKTIKSKSIPFMIPPIMGLMIDTEFEFQIAKWILENKLLKSKKFLKNFHIKN